MKKGVIYTVRHRSTDKVCYVGQTRLKPERRWSMHLRDDTPVSRTLQMFGVEEFEFSVIETIPEQELNAREAYWIKQFNTLSPNGLNCTAGGHSSRKSATTRARISAAKKRQCADPAYRAALSERAKKIHSDPKVRANKRAAWTPEKRAEMSARMKALAGDPQRSKKVSDALLKGWANPEIRERRIRAAKARWANPEERAKASARRKAYFSARKERA